MYVIFMWYSCIHTRELTQLYLCSAGKGIVTCIQINPSNKGENACWKHNVIWFFITLLNDLPYMLKSSSNRIITNITSLEKLNEKARISYTCGLRYLWEKRTTIEFKQGPQISKPLSRNRINSMKIHLYES